jgi:hypothetical protein
VLERTFSAPTSSAGRGRPRRPAPHRVGAAEAVEVVGVQAAQVDLQGVEDVGHRHAQLARLGAVDVGVELRHVDLPAREQAGQLGRLVGLGHEGLLRRVQRVVAQRGAVLDLQLEAAGGAQALHRRRREHGDEGVLDAAELLVELLGDGAGAQRRVLALVEGLQRHEDDAGVGAVGEAVDRQAGEGDGVLHAGLLHDDLVHAPDHRLGAVQRGAVGQLGEADQVLLVLRRHEAPGTIWNRPTVSSASTA